MHSFGNNKYFSLYKILLLHIYNAHICFLIYNGNPMSCAFVRPSGVLQLINKRPPRAKLCIAHSYKSLYLAVFLKFRCRYESCVFDTSSDYHYDTVYTVGQAVF